MDSAEGNKMKLREIQGGDGENVRVEQELMAEVDNNENKSEVSTTASVDMCKMDVGDDKTNAAKTCICGSSDESSFMICCDHCGVWYHGVCLQVTRTQAIRIETYTCPPCIEKNRSLRVVYRTQKRDRQEKKDKGVKARKAKLSTRRALKDEDETYGEDKCNSCINCFRTENCGKCSHCNALMEPCVKRICLQSDYWKNKQQILGHPQGATFTVRTASPKSKREKQKGNSFDDGDEQTVSSSTTTRLNKPKKGRKRATSSKVSVAQKKQASHSGRGRPSSSSTAKRALAERTFSAEEQWQIAALMYERYTRRTTKKVEVRHCQGPQCENSARPNSKFCSDDCGMQLARDRLNTILPERASSFWGITPRAAEYAKSMNNAIEEHIQGLSNDVRKFALFHDEVEQWVALTSRFEPVDDSDQNNLEADFVLHCAVCTMEFPAKQIVKHAERCFVRTERQSCYGTPNKSYVNPYNIFCDQYNKTNNTYCKRLRVLCSEHYKPAAPEEVMKICGYPFAWGKNEDSRPVDRTFENMKELASSGFCLRRRKHCSQHHNWIQNAVGLVDVELLNHLIKLDEWIAKKRSMNVKETLRGDVLSLLCNKTVAVGAKNDGETSGEQNCARKDVENNQESNKEGGDSGSEQSRGAEVSIVDTTVPYMLPTKKEDMDSSVDEIKIAAGKTDAASEKIGIVTENMETVAEYDGTVTEQSGTAENMETANANIEAVAESMQVEAANVEVVTEKMDTYLDNIEAVIGGTETSG